MTPEHPILFKTPLVLALLDRRKTETRRVVPPGTAALRDREEIRLRCPYGGPGHRLWVRETVDSTGPVPRFKADGRVVPRYLEHRPLPKKVVPSIHMPRWACRLVLKVTEVRVERLQEIGPEGVRAEGCVWSVEDDPARAFAALWDSVNGHRVGRAWAQNPLVWVVRFRPGG